MRSLCHRRCRLWVRSYVQWLVNLNHCPYYGLLLLLDLIYLFAMPLHGLCKELSVNKAIIDFFCLLLVLLWRIRYQIQLTNQYYLPLLPSTTIMQIRKAKSPVQVPHKQPPEQKHNKDPIKQIVTLTKENKYLKDQLEVANKEIEYLRISKAKYKFKYKKLKKEAQDHARNQKSIDKSRKRELSGKIYRQKISYPGQQEGKINALGSPPRTRPNPQAFFSPYYSNKNIKQNTLVQIPFIQIQTGIQSILNILTSINKNEEKQMQFDKILQKMSQIQEIIVQKVKGTQLCLNKLVQQSSKRCETGSSGIKQRYRSSSQQNNCQPRQMASGNSPPQKDQLNCQQYYYATKKHKDNEQKMRKSKSHRSLNDPKKLKSVLSKNHKYEQEKESSEGQSTRSKWQMLNQLGKKLENWKFTNSDNSDHEPEDQQNKYS